MSRITGGLKAAYNFISGDAITMIATLVAFALCGVLVSVAHAPVGAVATLFVVIIVAGLIATLWREIAGRPRTRS